MEWFAYAVGGFVGLFRVAGFRAVLVAGVVGGSAIVGCAAGAEGRAPMRLEASPLPFATDVPVPVGFTLVERSSEDWSNQAIRYVRHRYVGRADKASVRAFYQREMPLVRWSPTSDANVHGRYTLRFTRGDEACTVEVHGGDSGSARRVWVDVLIAPAPRGGPAN